MFIDHPYILAFSLIMLHTDAFNKSNKRKMTKPDYVKNTRLPGVPPEVLDVSQLVTVCTLTWTDCEYQCFYDNIVFAPFIFIEDPLDVNGQRGLLPENPSTRRLSTLNVPSPGGMNGSGSTLLSKNSKIDPYYLITRVSAMHTGGDLHRTKRIMSRTCLTTCASTSARMYRLRAHSITEGPSENGTKTNSYVRSPRPTSSNSNTRTDTCLRRGLV